MKIKRIFSFAVVIALLCAFAIGVAACGDTQTIKVNDEFLGTSDPQYAVDGMSAYDLIMEAYANWCDDDGYVRREQFVFTAEIFEESSLRRAAPIFCARWTGSVSILRK